MSFKNDLRDPKIKTIGDMFIRNAEKFENEIGVVSGDIRLTWGEVNRRVNRLANGLLRMGLNKGDRVAVLNKNNHLWAEVHGGVAKAGGIIVPLNYRLASRELERIINDAGVRFLIVEESFVPKIQEICSRVPGLGEVICYNGSDEVFLDYEMMLSNSSDSEPESQNKVKEEDVHAILYTGGTTGDPKGAMWLHERTLDTVYYQPFPLELSFRGRMLIYFALHAGGVTATLLCGIYASSYIVILDFDPVKVLETIEKERIELLGGVPTIMKLLMESAGERRYDVNSLKRINYGAMPIQFSLLKRALAFFSCEFVQTYGMTENTGLNLTQLEHHDHVVEGCSKKMQRLASAGRPIRGREVRIFDENDHEVPRGEVGEIVCKSMSLMAGYWNQPEDTEKAMRGGWYHTGDMGWMDEEGYVFIVDRKNSMIISGGLNVYPTEVEAVILQHQAVLETCVLGAKDPTWGERIVGVVRLKQGKQASAGEIQQFCRKHLAGYKVPKKLLLLGDPLPRNPFGKVLRQEVKRIFQQAVQ